MSIGVITSVAGLKAIASAVAEEAQAYQGALEAAIYQKAVEIMAKAIPLTPAATGILRSTHYVSKPMRGISGPVVEIGFGTSYAEAVHEMSGVSWKAPGTGGKYLQRPVDQAKKGWEQDMAAKTKRNRAKDIRFQGGAMPTSPRKVSDAEVKAANRAARVGGNQGGAT